MSLIKSAGLPKALEATIENALLKAFGSTEISCISTISDGLSGAAVYRIILNDKPYVLKVDPGAATPASSINGHELASAAGIAPIIRYDDRTRGITISDYIDGQAIPGTFSHNGFIRELSGTIRAIHLIPPHKEASDLFGTIDGLINKFTESKMLWGELFEECFHYYESIKQNFVNRREDLVFSHNDLNPKNILVNARKLWIIDWDACSLNNRYFDLASAANFFIHTEEQEHLFLNIYFDNKVDDRKRAYFYIMRQICRIIYALLMFQVAKQGKPANCVHNSEMGGHDLKTFSEKMSTGILSLADYEGQLFYGKALINEAVFKMRSPIFTDSLIQMKL